MKAFTVDPSRLRGQVVYFAFTAQIINFAFEVVVPYVKRNAFQKVQEIRESRAGHDTAMLDPPEETTFLARVRNEAQLAEYDVTVDLREMCIQVRWPCAVEAVADPPSSSQYGYLSLFSVVWPLTALAFLINNWIELRSDAVKICVEMRRPIPWRADTIGPGLDSLAFLTWLGSLSTAALVYMFTGDGLGQGGATVNIALGGLMLSLFFAEQIYLVVGIAVRTALSKIDSPGLRKERGQRFLVRKRYLEDSLGHMDATRAAAGGAAEKINRASLEEEARQSTLQESRPEDRFWVRQKYWQETVKVGASFIKTNASNEAKKTR